MVDTQGVYETFEGTIADQVCAGPVLEDGRFSTTSSSPRTLEGPDLEALPATCALDIVDEHGDVSRLSVAYLLNISRERVRQIEEAALEKVRLALRTRRRGRR